MNEKFFDLKKEKQDRMINAALKIFAQNGYAHASTDDIVKEAGISKGLLFHYFGNKIGLYSFIYDYSVRYVCLEMTSTVDKSDNDYFSLLIQFRLSEMNVMKTYPYMVAFLLKANHENVIEALNEIYAKKTIVGAKMKEYLDRANTSHIKESVDIIRITELIDYAKEAILIESLLQDDSRPELYYEEIRKHILMLKNISNK